MLFLSLLISVLSDDDCRTSTVKLPDYCTTANTIILSRRESRAFKIPINFSGVIVQPSNPATVTLTNSTTTSSTPEDYVCVVMWGAGFLKYDSGLQFRTDAWIASRNNECYLDAQSKKASQSKDNAFILNMDEDAIGLVRFHRTGGSGTLYLYNSAELEIEGTAYVSNEAYATGTLSNRRDDEVTLAFFADGNFSLQITSQSQLELEAFIFDCQNSEMYNGECNSTESERDGYPIIYTGHKGEFIYFQVENDDDRGGDSIKCDFTFQRLNSYRSVEESSGGWSQDLTTKIKFSTTDYIYAYGDSNSSKTVIIVCCTVGGVVVVGAAAGVGYWIWRKKRVHPA